MRHRPAVLIGIAAAGTFLLSGCGGDGYNMDTAPGTIVHLEYIPASVQTVDDSSCSGDGVSSPQICSGGSHPVLQKQCWRVDVHKKWKDWDGTPQDMVIPTCVFPSEFKTMKVGDPWTKPTVTY